MSVARRLIHRKRRKFPGTFHWWNDEKSLFKHYSRVIGTLLGSIDGGVVTLSNCYKVPHKEDEDEVAINMDFNEHLFRLQKKVGPNEVIVGWFTTSKCKCWLALIDDDFDYLVIEEKDRLVHQYYHSLMSTRSGKGGVHPVVLMVDTAPANGKIDIKGEKSSLRQFIKRQ